MRHPHMTTVSASSPRLKRRWLQFSLRTLLVTMLVVGAASGWIGSRLQRARHQEQVVKQLTQLGASVFYDFEWENFEEVLLTLNFDSPRTPPGPEWLRSLVGDDCFRRVVGVHFQSGHRSEEVVRLAATLPDVIYLNLSGYADQNLTDAGLAALANLPKLEQLEVNNSARITNDGLRVLPRLTKLQGLVLTGNKQMDVSGLRHIAGLPNLRTLEYDANCFDEDDLGQLCGVTSLQKLKLLGLVHSMKALATLGRLPALEELSFEGRPLGDFVSSHDRTALRSLHNLKKLELWAAQSNGIDNLEWLAEIPNLEELRIQGSEKFPSDELLSVLARLKKLRVLRLESEAVTSDGMVHLTALKKLEVLDLAGTDVGDRAVPYLQQMKSLKELYLPTPISADSRRWHLDHLPMLKNY
jgi:Leucine-rich repeat (LRR) protein